MTGFYYEQDADLRAISDQSLAIVGYGNQGRPWAPNLRDSDLNARVCVRNDETRAQAEGYPTLQALKDLHAGEGVRIMERDLMRKLGSGAK